MMESSEPGVFWILAVVVDTRGYMCGKPTGSPAPTRTHTLVQIGVRVWQVRSEYALWTIAMSLYWFWHWTGIVSDIHTGRRVRETPLSTALQFPANLQVFQNRV